MTTIDNPIIAARSDLDPRAPDAFEAMDVAELWGLLMDAAPDKSNAMALSALESDQDFAEPLAAAVGHLLGEVNAHAADELLRTELSTGRAAAISVAAYLMKHVEELRQAVRDAS